MSGFDLTGSPSMHSDHNSGVNFEQASAESFPLSDVKHLLPESVKAVAESIGLSGFSDDAARELAEDATFRLKTLLQDAHKFMVHSRRNDLRCEDIDLALKSEGKAFLRVSQSTAF